MLKPAIEPRRRRSPTLIVTLAFVTGAVVGVGGAAVGFALAPHRVVIVERPPPDVIRAQVMPPEIEIVAEPSHRPTATLTARISPRSEAMDLVSPDRYVPNGNADEVIDLTLASSLAVKHIFLNGNGGAHQWDTVIGDDPIPFGRVFGGHRGDATYHVGVREDGQWQTDPKTGALRVLSAGTHRLELYGDGASDGPGARTVTVMFVDGTTMTAPVEASGNYPAQMGGRLGAHNSD